MKMLIISDTHSNYVALVAVAHTKHADEVLIIDEVGYLGLDHAVLGIAKAALIILAASEATGPSIGLEMRGQLLKLRDADLPVVQAESPIPVFVIPAVKTELLLTREARLLSIDSNDVFPSISFFL